MLVTAAILAALLYFRGEFYAIGDPRTRWRALQALLWLAVADIVIGVSWLYVTRGLDGDYSLWQRIESTVTNTGRVLRAGRVLERDPRPTSSPPCAAGSACSP